MKKNSSHEELVTEKKEKKCIKKITAVPFPQTFF